MKIKKRVFFRVWYNLLMVVFLLLPTLGAIIYCSIVYPKKMGILICLSILLLFTLLIVLRLIIYYLIFYEDNIMISGEIPILGGKNQYKDEIEYAYIINIRLVYAFEDSRKQKINTFARRGAFRANEFIELVQSDHKTNRLLVNFFTSKQKQKMLNIIGEKTGIYKDYKQLQADAKRRIDAEIAKWKP